jgi:hypothetical protein
MDFGMDMTPTMALPNLTRRERAEKCRGQLKIRTPKNAIVDKKWFGVPPTPLSTKPKWRAGGPIAF